MPYNNNNNNNNNNDKKTLKVTSLHGLCIFLRIKTYIMIYIH